LLLARYIIAIIPILLICTYSPSTIDPVLVPRTLALSFVLLLLSGWFLIRRQKDDPLLTGPSLNIHIPTLLILGGYLLASGLGVLRGVNQAEALFDLSKTLLILPLLFVLITAIRSSKSAIITLLKGVLIVGFVAQFIGIYQLWGWMIDPAGIVTNIAEVSSTLANKNLYSSFVVFTLPLGFIAYKQFSKSWKTVALSYLILTSFHAVILQTRAGWLALVVALLVLLIVFGLSGKKPGAIRFWKQVLETKKHIALYVLILVGLTTASVIVKPEFLSDTYQKTVYIVENTNSQEVKYGSVGNRFDMWSHTFEMYKDEPVLGQGLASWKFLLPDYGQIGRKTEQGRMYFQRPHNDFLWVFAELGTIGGLLYLSIFLVPFFLLLRMLFKKTDRDKSTAYLLLFGLTIYGVISCFSFPKERIVHLFLLVFYLALILEQYHQFYPKKTRTVQGLSQKLVWAGCTVLMGFTLLVSSFRISGEKYTHEAHVAASEGDLQGVLTASENAINSFYSVDPISTPMHWYMGIVSAELEQYDVALGQFREAMKYHPNHLLVLNNLASCLHLTGESDSAIHYYERALEISPLFSESLCNLSILYFNRGEVDLAFNTIAQCPLDAELPALHADYLQAILSAKYAHLERAMSSQVKKTEFKIFLENKIAVLKAYTHCKNKGLDVEIYLISKFS
jgi:O-antigen ligase